ncbi:MAG: tRNA lysidine(34) synthetase TilS [Mariniblastus sp.]|nr:tRNA lysidine(34) synthetase TilS [Mariniblastus sp.]
MIPPNNEPPNFVSICQSLTDRWSAESWFQQPFMVAVSGGADSVLLLRVLVQLRMAVEKSQELIVAHVDHAIRESSADDAEFVKRLAELHGLRFVSQRLDLDDLNSQSPSEDFLRQARYEQLMQMANSCGARYLATGHNLEDQVETALFRIFRGTAFSGLQGIPPLRVDGAVSIVRPLLHVSRQTILAALDEINQPFCTDSSNQTSDYTRNFLRNEILPPLRQRFPAVDGAVMKLVELATEFEQYLDRQAETFSNAFIEHDTQSLTLDKSILEQADPLVIAHLLTRAWQDRDWPRQDMNRDWWRKLSDLTRQKDEQVVLNLPGNIRVESDRHKLRIRIQTPPGK